MDHLHPHPPQHHQHHTGKQRPGQSHIRRRERRTAARLAKSKQPTAQEDLVVTPDNIEPTETEESVVENTNDLENFTDEVTNENTTNDDPAEEANTPVKVATLFPVVQDEFCSDISFNAMSKDVDEQNEAEKSVTFGDLMAFIQTSTEQRKKERKKGRSRQTIELKSQMAQLGLGEPSEIPSFCGFYHIV